MNKDNFIKLNDGKKIPIIGEGTYPMTGIKCQKAIKSALKCGYRLFDTSPAYANEKEIGNAIFKGFSGYINRINRKNIFISSKLFLDACRTNSEIKQLKNSLKLLKIDYLDLWLLHWADLNYFIKNYKCMEKAQKEGLVKSIGVCNCEIYHLERILNECDIVPAINQIECHPLLTQKKIINFCNKHNIIVEAYSPLARIDKRLYKNNILINLQKKYNKSISQIILKWHIQQNRIVIPKSSDFNRLKENYNIFDFKILDSDLNKIDSLNQDLRIRFDPYRYPIEN